MTWLRDKLIGALPAQLASPPEPGFRVPDDLPVHRPEILGQLAGELPAPTDALRYRDNFARLLSERIERLTADIRSNDRADAVATLLSLRVGSTMVGASRLHHVVDLCLTQVRSGRRTECLPFLIQEADRFLSYLADSDDIGLEPSDVRPEPPVQAPRPSAPSNGPHRGPS